LAKSLQEKLQEKKFVVTVEADPPKGADPWGTYEKIRPLAKLIDAVNIADCPMARMKMSPIALAHLVQDTMGLETIFHLTCRDRNLIGLQSELLGAYAMGVRNILAVTGDNPNKGDHPDAKGVFEINSAGLIDMAHKLNSGQDYMGNKLDSGTDFFVGGVLNPTAVNIDAELRRVDEKIASGVQFFQTQPIFDLQQLETFLEKAKNVKVPIIYGLMPLKSLKLANYLNKNVNGIHVPENIIKSLEEGGRDAGIEVARQLYQEMKTMVSGVHIYPMGDAEMTKDILKG
jgi:5,10-methylenetetrahydrofolate reductase